MRRGARCLISFSFVISSSLVSGLRNSIRNLSPPTAPELEQFNQACSTQLHECAPVNFSKDINSGEGLHRRMASARKPTILLVPGSWFSPAAYMTFVVELLKAGYEVVTSSYPSLDPPEQMVQEITCEMDTQHLLERYLLPLVENQGKDVLMLMHSYAGMPGAGAATGLSNRVRQRQGKKGGVVGLVMISGFLVPEGLSCAGSMGGSLPPWIAQDEPSNGFCVPIDPAEVMAADLQDREAAEALAYTMSPAATISFFSPQPAPAFKERDYQGLLGYVKLEQDKAIPPVAQDGMMMGTGERWSVKELNGSHNIGFLDKAPQLVGMISEFASEFTNRLGHMSA